MTKILELLISIIENDYYQNEIVKLWPLKQIYKLSGKIYKNYNKILKNYNN